MSREEGREDGVGLIAAIFVIVVLGILGTGLVALVTTEQRATSREMASARAFYAAETALQWGMYQVVNKTGSGNFPNNGSPIFGGTPPNGLDACGDQTQVIQAAPVELVTNVPAVGGAVDLYRFEVAGLCYPDSQLATRRRLEVRFGD